VKGDFGLLTWNFETAALAKPRIRYCDHATLNPHVERQDFYALCPRNPHRDLISLTLDNDKGNGLGYNEEDQH
jgi:hypothetical protein